jgi:hypothetical protein
MEIWSPGKTSRPLPETLTSVPSIGQFCRITINGESSFPYLDIKLSWNENNCLNFNVHKKPNKLMKYLNTHSHHYHHHKSAVLSGVELRLTLLTTMTPKNADLSISTIYPDKNEALQTAGQLKENRELQTLQAVLKDESQSGPLQLERKSHKTDHHDTLFITKYANLGPNTRPINQVIKKLRNQYNLRWLRPRVVYSRHMNLHKKLLGNLKQKLLIGIVNADLGQWPCNCLMKFKVNGACAFGGDEPCCTTGVIYKVSCCASQSCNCFYICKSQQYIKNTSKNT